MKIPLLVLLLLTLLPLPALGEAAPDPYTEIVLNASPAEEPLILRGLDFAGGAALIRLKAETEAELTVRLHVDSPEGEPALTALFRPVQKESRRTLSLIGVHDLYITLEGSGTLRSLQAFATQEAMEKVLRSEQGSVENAIPARYTMPCAKKGTVEKFTYTAHDYAGDGAGYEKTAWVYLPFGCDPQVPCSLLILCHGLGDNEASWGLPQKDSRLRNILDNLIDRGEIRPLLVVTPNGRAGKAEDYSPYYLFDQELRNDLLPALAERYPVAVQDREQCAMAGLSMGGMQTLNLGIGRCLDLFSAFGVFSAAPTSNPALLTAGVLNAHRDLPVRVLYSVCGLEDGIALSSANAATQGLMGMTGQLDEGNFFDQRVHGGHDFAVWHLGVYNFVRLFAGTDQ